MLVTFVAVCAADDKYARVLYIMHFVALSSTSPPVTKSVSLYLQTVDQRNLVTVSYLLPTTLLPQLSSSLASTDILWQLTSPENFIVIFPEQEKGFQVRLVLASARRMVPWTFICIMLLLQCFNVFRMQRLLMVISCTPSQQESWLDKNLRKRTSFYNHWHRPLRKKLITFIFTNSLRWLTKISVLLHYHLWLQKGHLFKCIVIDKMLFYQLFNNNNSNN